MAVLAIYGTVNSNYSERVGRMVDNIRDMDFNRWHIRGGAWNIPGPYRYGETILELAANHPIDPNPTI